MRFFNTGKARTEMFVIFANGRKSIRLRAIFGTKSDDDLIFELCILQSAMHMLEELSRASKVCGASRKVLEFAKFRGVFERFVAQILHDFDYFCELFSAPDRLQK